MSKKLPAMPVYIGDLKKDPGFMGLTHEERWWAMDIFFCMWESSDRGYLILNGAPMPDEAIAANLGISVKTWLEFREKIIRLGVVKVEEKIEEKTGKKSEILFNSRMKKSEKIRKIRKKVGLKGVNSRLKKELKGKILHKQNRSKSLNFAKQIVENENENERLSFTKNNQDNVCSKKKEKRITEISLKDAFEQDWKSHPLRGGSNRKRAFEHYRKSVGCDLDTKRPAYQAKTAAYYAEGQDMSIKKRAERWMRDWRDVDVTPVSATAVSRKPSIYERNRSPVLAELAKINNNQSMNTPSKFMRGPTAQENTETYTQVCLDEENEN